MFRIRRILWLQQYLPFTVLKPVEPKDFFKLRSSLQQYLPFTVLKLVQCVNYWVLLQRLQQYLPFTVLKLEYVDVTEYSTPSVATVLTVYGIETAWNFPCLMTMQQKVATVLTVYGIETIGKIAKSSEDAVSCNSTYRLRY